MAGVWPLFFHHPEKAHNYFECHNLSQNKIGERIWPAAIQFNVFGKLLPF